LGNIGGIPEEKLFIIGSNLNGHLLKDKNGFEKIMGFMDLVIEMKMLRRS